MSLISDTEAQHRQIARDSKDFLLINPTSSSTHAACLIATMDSAPRMDSSEDSIETQDHVYFSELRMLADEAS